MLQFYGLAADPDTLSDEDWAMKIAHLKRILEMENKRAGR